MRDEVSNSGMISSDAAELANRNTSGLTPQKKYCCDEDVDESVGSAQENIDDGSNNELDVNLSDSDSDDSSVKE